MIFIYIVVLVLIAFAAAQVLKLLTAFCKLITALVNKGQRIKNNSKIIKDLEKDKGKQKIMRKFGCNEDGEII